MTVRSVQCGIIGLPTLPAAAASPQLACLVNWIAQKGSEVGNVWKPEYVSTSDATNKLIKVRRCM